VVIRDDKYPKLAESGSRSMARSYGLIRRARRLFPARARLASS
jgi:hypothetical protein